ncbi:MAG: tRNA (N(6)-L-threonylcarbamoyladenosine(37)-C(2))-methylthiotransferase MtaB [Bacteroidales bacterium]|nr:tRNA (N(6)-L-threonylcarbamoyladenosine(37)-C(2))-methylthiotransferase MtaB [Bacteroidales bacterium]
MKIAFLTLGCKLNYAETSTYERLLARAGFEAVSWNSGKADAYLVNTCSVTEHSDKKGRNLVRKLHRISPSAPIFVAGCSAQLRRESYCALEGVVRVFSADEKALVAPQIQAYLSASGNGSEAPSAVLTSSSELTPCQMFPAYSGKERTRSFLKVQDGCDYKCHYCTVPYARGESRNAPIAQLVEMAREIAAGGTRELVITGVNTGDFGKTTGESFFDLLKALEKVEGIERFRISSIEPNLLTEAIIDWIAGTSRKFLPHFHIPLQSGCDAILEAMGRRYRTADFRKKIQYIREKLGPDVFLGIDVIVGFPGESETDFEATYRFLEEEIRPAFIHIFPYSRRPGTPAATMKDQVQDSVKTERVRRLEELCRRLHAEFVRGQIGREEEVLFESSDKNGYMFGYTRNYVKVRALCDTARMGQLVRVRLDASMLCVENEDIL